MFRIALGSCSCGDGNDRAGIGKVACQIIFEKLEYLKKLSFSQLSGLPDVDTSNTMVDGFEIYMAVQLEKTNDEILIVVQAFHPTWKFPNYISPKGIGKKYVEGFIGKQDGLVIPAPEERLWQYR